MEPGTKIVRGAHRYRLVELTDDEAVMTTRHAGAELEVTETRGRFDEELEAGRAVVHPACDHCGLPVDPDGAMSDDEHDVLHEGCWFEHASVRDRCVHESTKAGWPSSMACRALAADATPAEYLLGVIGDPARSFDDRCDAEHFLTYAVDTRTIIEHQVRCPNCGEGEVFPMDPGTGEVRCHCGELMKPAD
jgi:ribosomal protein S27AE